MSMLLFPEGGSHYFPYHDFYHLSSDLDSDSSSSSPPFHLRRQRQRQQQQSLQLPNYTSPPTEQALLATPEAYRSDAVINQGRSAAAAGHCNASAFSVCQIIFLPPTFASSSFSSTTTTDAQMGVVLYGGALVDPRAYSPLALTLSTRYGLPTVIPIFAQDLAWSPLQAQCASGRVALAQAAVPSVQTWILVGHSAGGLAAQLDAYAWYINTTKTVTSSSSSSSPPLVGGLVLLGSYISNQILCDNRTVDFSNTTLPMAVLDGSNDEIVNHTNFEQGFTYVPANTTYSLIIIGGNHAGFGSYNDSLRTPILHQTDGIPTIPPVSQWDSTTSAIYNVVARASSTGNPGGASLPSIPSPATGTPSLPPSTASTTSQAQRSYYGVVAGAFAPFSMPQPWLGGTEVSWTLSIVLLFWMLRRSSQ